MAKGTKVDELNPRTMKYEFLGPPGAFVISIVVPIVLYALYFGCSEASGGHPPSLSLASLRENVGSAVGSVEWWRSLWDWDASLAYLGWYAFCVASWAVLPGKWVEGTTLRTGEKLKYKVNALPTFFLAISIALAVIIRGGPQAFTFIYEKWVGLVSAALLMSFVQATACYIASFRPDALLALGGNSGNVVYDWFIGRELNPGIGCFDISTFNELRPSMILWELIDISMVCEQAVRRGGFVNVTASMWLVLAFHTLYVFDCMYNESALFTTMDVTTDGFGFMLSVGDLVWIPFTFSLQARYLAFRHVELGALGVIGVISVNAVGYWIFRSANGEKNEFRNGKNPKNLKYMDTKRGTKLLITGWWGVCQHPNYMGDLIMSVAWCLPTGFSTPITYFYPVYFTALLVHRQMRDDEACAQKYGDDWKKYKKLVPYKIVPGIY
ncbi:C-14 sterol reductase [Ephemerocybe angulata]|uniref:Delta(14)-sterol reductase ERG24 n=1 Tax=Ephemerocybe angulata TaxID=980116 RepID=A0A8H6M9L5_9AGAR|nr:C-14 sterol reductase [Tulosesus angulatus]